jgi:hypothetical protein
MTATEVTGTIVQFTMLKYGILGAVITAELDLIFRLLKPTFMVDISVWIGFIVSAGLNISVHFLLLRLPIKWERFEPKKLAEKILRLDEIHN